MTKVVILSGVSGSGKSRLATKMYDAAKAQGKSAQICSADSYFEGPNGCAFDYNKLPDAHAFCFSQYLLALASGVDLVIVSNTNLTSEDISPYMLGASAYGCKAELITIAADPKDAAARNVHGLTESAVSRQEAKLANRHLRKEWAHSIYVEPSENSNAQE